MDGSNKKRIIVSRQSAAGMGLCVAGLGLLLWTIFGQFVGAAHEPMLLFVALPVLVGLGLIVAGFALMVAGAEPFEDDSGGVRDSDDPASRETARSDRDGARRGESMQDLDMRHV